MVGGGRTGHVGCIILPNKDNKLHKRAEGRRLRVIDEPWRAAHAEESDSQFCPPPHQQHSSGCTRTTRALFHCTRSLQQISGL